MQVFLLPPEDEEAAVEAVQHALGLLTSALSSQRALGAMQLLTLLHPHATWRTVLLACNPTSIQTCCAWAFLFRGHMHTISICSR